MHIINIILDNGDQFELDNVVSFSCREELIHINLRNGSQLSLHRVMVKQMVVHQA